jgi:hypothetical protein
VQAVDALVQGDAAALLAACPGGNSAHLRVPCPMQPCPTRWDTGALLRRQPRIAGSLLLGVKLATEVAAAAALLEREKARRRLRCGRCAHRTSVFVARA